MSEFRRTARGLNNQHLFHDVDLIVFLEGGSTSYSKAEVYDDKYNAETEDIIFWQNVFLKFNNGRKIKFKSIGSKTLIKEIVIDIVNGELTTILVAMDNEFDEIFNKRIEHNNVFYTHGYSWENDVWNSNVIIYVIEELTAIDIAGNEIEDNFNEFIRKIRLAVYTDAYLFRHNSSFFPRKSGHLFCVDCTAIDLPSVKKSALENKFAQTGLKKNTIYSFGRRNSIDSLKFCYGHLLADYCYQLISHYIKKRHALTTVSKDIIYRMGIKKYFQYSFEGSNIYEYYRNQFEQKFIP